MIGTGNLRLPGYSLIFLLLASAALAQPAPPTGYRSGVLGAHDHRVPVVPDRWPFSSIGRVNVILGMRRSHCTGTLIGPRQVITAAHCLFDGKINQFVKPQAVHFVAAQDRETPSSSRSTRGARRRPMRRRPASSSILATRCWANPARHCCCSTATRRGLSAFTAPSPPISRHRPAIARLPATGSRLQCS
jgi:hypothetical protein